MAGGYYDIHQEGKTAPQTELIQKIAAEPGFVTRYAIAEYLKWRAERNQEVRARTH
jgi:hypothetical protein